MKKLLLFCTLAVLQTLSFGQSFSLQIINNSTSGAPENLFPLDIYINDSLFASSVALDYRSATEYLSVPLEENTQIAIAASPSDSSGQAFVIYNLGQFEAGNRYLAVLNGAFGSLMQPFRLELAAGLPAYPVAEDRIFIRPFNGLGNSSTARLEIQRSSTPSPRLAAGQFGDFSAQATGRQILNVFIGEKPSPVRFALDLPPGDSTQYTLLSTGLNDAFPLPELYAVATDDTVIPATILSVPEVVINEIDYNQPGADEQEFIELKNIGTETINLGGMLLELYNGSIGSNYEEIELPEAQLAPQSYYVVCFSESVDNCDLQLTGSIQNGGTAPDAVILSQDGAIIDAVSYEGTLVGITEGNGENLEDGDEENISLSRLPDGIDNHNNSNDFSAVCSTPGTANLPNSSCTLSATRDSTLVQIINDYEGAEPLRVLIGDLDLGALSYQSATPFVKVPAGVFRNLSVLEDLDGPINRLAEVELTLALDSTYTFVVEGSALSDLSLSRNPEARAEAQVPFATDFNFYYGLEMPAPLDILIKRVGFATRELSGFHFSEYRSALPGIYLLDLIDPVNGETIATFELDLLTSGGAAQTILISRALDQAEGFVLYSFDAQGNRKVLPLVEFAQVQLIQNIPNIEVDVYIDDVLFADNVNYRSATSFLEIRANKPLSLEVKGAESTPSDPSILSFENIRFESLSSSLLVLGGDGTERSPVDLFILKNVLEQASAPEELALAFFHGGTDVDPLTFLGEQFEEIAPELNFGRFADYQSFAADDLVLAARESDSGQNLGFFGADLSAKKGQAGLVFTSGVVSDSQTFGMYVAFADGTVVPLAPRPYTRVQFVNNAPDTLGYQVLLGDRVFAENLSFQTATPYLNIPANTGTVLQASVPLPMGDSLIILQENFVFSDTLTYQLFLSGQLDNETYPLTFAINDQAKEFSDLDFSLDVMVHNGVFSSGAQDWLLESGTPLAEALAYGTFFPATTLPPNQQLIRIREQGTNRSLGAFNLSLDQVGPGAVITLFTSGLRDSDLVPGLYAVLPDGTVLSFSSITFAKWQLVNNIDQSFDVYLDGELLSAGLDYRMATPFQTVSAGVAHELVLAPIGMDPVQASRRLSFTPQAEEVMSVFAAGSDSANSLFMNRNARDNAGGENKFLFNFFQGSPAESALDLLIQNFTRLYREVAFGTFTDYTLIEPLSSDPMLIFEVARSADAEVIGVYDADFSPFGNQAMTIFTSGTTGDDFSLWAALPDGLTFPFSLITNVQAAVKEELSLRLYPNPASSQVNLELDLEEKSRFSYLLMDVNGRILLQQQNGEWPKGRIQERIALDNIPAGLYFLEVRVGIKKVVLPLKIK